MLLFTLSRHLNHSQRYWTIQNDRPGLDSKGRKLPHCCHINTSRGGLRLTSVHIFWYVHFLWDDLCTLGMVNWHCTKLGSSAVSAYALGHSPCKGLYLQLPDKMTILHTRYFLVHMVKYSVDFFPYVLGSISEDSVTSNLLGHRSKRMLIFRHVFIRGYKQKIKGLGVSSSSYMNPTLLRTFKLEKDWNTFKIKYIYDKSIYEKY